MAAAKCPATLTLQRKLQQAMASCTACAPQVEYLEQLAGVCPDIAEQIGNLRLLLDHIEGMARVGLAYNGEGELQSDAET